MKVDDNSMINKLSNNIDRNKDIPEKEIDYINSDSIENDISKILEDIKMQYTIKKNNFISFHNNINKDKKNKAKNEDLYLSQIKKDSILELFKTKKKKNCVGLKSIDYFKINNSNDNTPSNLNSKYNSLYYKSKINITELDTNIQFNNKYKAVIYYKSLKFNIFYNENTTIRDLLIKIFNKFETEKEIYYNILDSGDFCIENYCLKMYSDSEEVLNSYPKLKKKLKVINLNIDEFYLYKNTLGKSFNLKKVKNIINSNQHKLINITFSDFNIKNSILSLPITNKLISVLEYYKRNFKYLSFDEYYIINQNNEILNINMLLSYIKDNDDLSIIKKKYIDTADIKTSYKIEAYDLSLNSEVDNCNRNKDFNINEEFVCKIINEEQNNIEKRIIFKINNKYIENIEIDTNEEVNDDNNTFFSKIFNLKKEKQYYLKLKLKNLKNISQISQNKFILYYKDRMSKSLLKLKYYSDFASEIYYLIKKLINNY